MGLRLQEGLDVMRVETLAGQSLDQDILHRLMEEDLIETISNHHLRVTIKGRPVLNAIVRALSF